MSSVGREINSRFIVPGAYLTVPDRVGVASSRFMRLVKARAKDIATGRSEVWEGRGALDRR